MATLRQIKSKYSGKQELRQARKAAKEAKKRAQKIAKEQIKEMRPYLKSLRSIDLRKDITASQKGYITRAWNEYQELTTRPYKVYRTRNKQHLKLAQEFSRHEKGNVKFDVAFVPTADPKAKIKFKKDRVEIRSKYVTETVLFFNLKALARDPETEIRATLARNPNAKQFMIMAGKYLYNGGLARSLVEREVTKLMARYSNVEQNNYFGNWLFGVVASEFNEQRAFDEYRREYNKVKEQRKSAKRSERRRRGLKHGSKF